MDTYNLMTECYEILFFTYTKPIVIIKQDICEDPPPCIPKMGDLSKFED